MNLLQIAPAWAIAILCLALLAAAVEDVLRLRVSNFIVLVSIAVAGAAAMAVGLSVALWENLLIFVLLLAGGTLLFAQGKVGGGDVKLLAASGLWTDLENALILLAAIFISGGLLALGALLWRLFGRTDQRSPLRERTRGIPYAVAIAAGVLVVIVIEYQQSSDRRSNPLEFQSASS